MVRFVCLTRGDEMKPELLLSRILILLLFITILTFVAGSCTAPARTGESDPGEEQISMFNSAKMPESAGRVQAPEFPAGMQWLNTKHPLSLRDLRGKVILLDFWTYCCINCMHIIPDLKRLEKKYKDELIVIGVHSAKFTTEQETENIRQAILRYEIEHPVVNDRDMVIWRSYGVRAWPTLVLIDPAGKVVGSLSGEGIYDPFDALISKVVAISDASGLLNRKPLQLNLERYRRHESLLSFPGKVLAHGETGNLFVADSNHNRIVVASLKDGEIKEIVGSGGAGLVDGNFQTASFHHPQGMAFDGKVLFVADTENHAIRKVDFGARNVATIVGTGEQAAFIHPPGILDIAPPGVPGRRIPLNSPWDLVLVGKKLYIAMAGSHQIWVMNLTTGEIGPYAGSGREARADGLLEEAALAQPSGITTDGKKLYFADSESSSIRSADLPPGSQPPDNRRPGQLKVQTLVGLDLFEFGDRDGPGNQARLQHPLGVASGHGLLYVADTYNNKIKQVDPSTRKVQTLFGTGKAGFRDGPAPLLDEPGGVSVAHDRLYIADTNNHLIRMADLGTGQISTLNFKEMEKLGTHLVRPPATPSPHPTQTAPQSVRAGSATLTISVELPKGYKLNPLAPSRVIVAAEGQGNILFRGGARTVTIRPPWFPLQIPFQAMNGTGRISTQMLLYYCEAGKESLCYFKEVSLTTPIAIRAGKEVSGQEVRLAERAIKISYSLGLP